LAIRLHHEHYPQQKRILIQRKKKPVPKSITITSSENQKVGQSLKIKLCESKKKIHDLEILLQQAEQRVKEAEERALRDEQLILNMENEISLQSLLIKINNTNNLPDKNYKEALKQLQVDEKIDKLYSSIKEERKQLKEQRRTSKVLRSKKSSNSIRQILSPLPSSKSLNYLDEGEEERALNQLITQLLM